MTAAEGREPDRGYWEAFDKWRAMPVIDEERRVVDVLYTYF